MKIRLSKEQWDFLRKLGIDDRDYTHEEIEESVVEKIAEFLQQHGFEAGQENVNKVGAFCENIIDTIEDQKRDA